MCKFALCKLLCQFAIGDGWLLPMEARKLILVAKLRRLPPKQETKKKFINSSLPSYIVVCLCISLFKFLNDILWYMQASKTSAMAMNSYSYCAEVVVKDYLLADSLVPYVSVLSGIFMCKMAYDLTQLVSSFYYKGYTSLTKTQRVEWNNRGMSNVHAIFITLVSLYLVFASDLYSDALEGPITFRSSPLSSFTLGVSIGYFLTDLAMIFWLYPSLGGMEYVAHHLLSLLSLAYAMFSGEGQIYTYMVLISEATTPGINLRWFLDIAGMKRSKAYLMNGFVMFFSWLAVRILLFLYMFYHMYVHYDQIKQIGTFGRLLVLVVPSVLAIMNMMWFWKILKGLKKTLAKRQ